MPDNELLSLRYPAGSAPDSRKTVPWNELSKEVKMLVQRASNGSLEGLQVLVAWMELNKLTARQDRLVPILYRHLEKDPPSSFDSQPEILKATFASTSLEGVAQSFLWQLSVTAIETSQTLQHFTRFWDSIWKWINALYLRIYSKGLFYDLDTPLKIGTDEYRIVMAIRRLIIILTNDSFGLWPRLLQTPGFVSLLTDVWGRLSESSSGSAYSSDIWFNITTSFLSLIKDHRGIPIIVKALNGGVSRLATLILRNLRALTFDMELTDEYLRPALPLLAFISVTCIHTPRLGTALLAQHSIMEVMRTLAVLVNKRNTMQDPVHGCLIRSCVLSCLIYVQAVSKVTDGYTWLTQAVRSQVIQSVLKAAALPQPPTSVSGLTAAEIRFVSKISPAKLENELIATVQFLSMFLIFRSYTRELDRVMEDSVIPLLELRVPKDGQFWSSWKHFKAVIHSRVAVKAAFDKMGKYNLACSAPNVRPMSVVHHRIRRPNGMTISAEITKLRDTSNYAARAKLLHIVPRPVKRKIGNSGATSHTATNFARIEKGGLAPISDHDRHFIQFSANYDVIQYASQIFAVQKQLSYETGREDLVVYVEYSNPSVVIFVDSPEEFPEFVRRPVLAQRHLLKNTGYPEIYFVISVPFGKSRQILILGSDMADSPDLWIRKVLEHAGANYNEDNESIYQEMVIFRAEHLPEPVPFLEEAQGLPISILNYRLDDPSIPYA
ncbi:hypothetical protein C0992_005369 [Termitomyces sp. T32_za158]|nr:hypothetical protein C0992_005369 [Termitomyces sp. T32_za158]